MAAGMRKHLTIFLNIITAGDGQLGNVHGKIITGIFRFGQIGKFYPWIKTDVDKTERRYWEKNI